MWNFIYLYPVEDKLIFLHKNDLFQVFLSNMNNSECLANIESCNAFLDFKDILNDIYVTFS